MIFYQLNDQQNSTFRTSNSNSWSFHFFKYRENIIPELTTIIKEFYE